MPITITPDVLKFPINTSKNFSIVPLQEKKSSQLIYTLGSGKFISLVNDNVLNGFQLHEGNPSINTDSLLFTGQDKVTVETEEIKVISNNFKRGLLKGNFSEGGFWWDEIYTSPLGYYKFKPYSEVNTETPVGGLYSSNGVYGSENQFYIKIPTLVVPREGDFVVFQKKSSGDTGINEITNNYIIGNSKLLIRNEELTYIFKIVSVTRNDSNYFTLTFDKDVNFDEEDVFNIVFLNRDSVGFQSGLFEQTFEQIEIWRNSALGIQTADTVTEDIKNFIIYETSSYLGLQNLFSDLLKNKENFLENTPFILLDIDQEIKDRFAEDSTNNIFVDFANLNFTLSNNNGIKLKNEKLGNYSELFSNGSGAPTGVLGYVFYDLRVIVISDPELVFALSYNSNRNFLLKKPILNANNLIANSLSTLNLDIIKISKNVSANTVIRTNKPHSLINTQKIVLSKINVLDSFNNLLISETLNGTKYVERVDEYSFVIYEDIAFSIPTQMDGTPLSTIGIFGQVKGFFKQFDYFLTYSVETKYNTLTLPYAEVQNFNFDTNGKVQLTIPGWGSDLNTYIPKFNIIIGKWVVDEESLEPFKILSYEDLKFFNFTNNGTGSDLVSVTNFSEITQTLYEDNTNMYDIRSLFLSDTPESIALSSCKWFLGNVNYKTQTSIFRSKMKISVGAGEWNGTTNKTYKTGSKYISEIALTDPLDINAETPLVYAKICPAVEKRNDLDLEIQLQLDF